ncbi:MAG: hypothetical protein DRR19_29745 [Candidatus Parabeggiatoa sp. nov. 1]|nr:MAG: hypothetical protein DRR19_29745 [Gammaproteobacteria bacterium]
MSRTCTSFQNNFQIMTATFALPAALRLRIADELVEVLANIIRACHQFKWLTKQLIYVWGYLYEELS